MQGICEEVTGKKSARDLKLADLRHLLSELRDLGDNLFDPEEVYEPGGDD
jgi:hypothetical protein